MMVVAGGPGFGRPLSSGDIMPELPEVERGRRLADKLLCGKRIEKAAAARDTIVYTGVSPRRFAHALCGRRVLSTHRKGKYIWFALDERPWPVFHFGMSGSFRVYDHPGERPRFWKCETIAEDGTRLAMVNKRRLGRIRLLHARGSKE
jgi:formamidopyrimidine-DNA glycosylase